MVVVDARDRFLSIPDAAAVLLQPLLRCCRSGLGSRDTAFGARASNRENGQHVSTVGRSGRIPTLPSIASRGSERLEGMKVFPSY